MDLQNKNKGPFGFGRSRDRTSHLNSPVRPSRNSTPPSELYKQTFTSPSGSKEGEVNLGNQSSRLDGNQDPQFESIQAPDERGGWYNGPFWNFILKKTPNTQDSASGSSSLDQQENTSLAGPSSLDQQENIPLVEGNGSSVEKKESVLSSEGTNALQSHALEGELGDSNSVQSHALKGELEDPSSVQSHRLGSNFEHSNLANTVVGGSGQPFDLPRGGGSPNGPEIQPAPANTNTSHQCDSSQQLAEPESERLEEDSLTPPPRIIQDRGGVGPANVPMLPHPHNQRENVEEDRSSMRKVLSFFLGIHHKVFGHSVSLGLKPQLEIDSLTNIKGRVILEGGVETGGNRFEKDLKSSGFNIGGSFRVKDTELSFEKGVPFSKEESGYYVDKQITQFIGNSGFKVSAGRFSLDGEAGQNYGLFGHQQGSGLKLPLVKIPIWSNFSSGGDTKKFARFIPEFLSKKEITGTSLPVLQQNLDQKRQFDLLRTEIKKSTVEQINAMKFCARETRQFNENLHLEHWKAEKGLHVQHWQAEKEFFSKQVSPEQISSLQNELLEQHKQVLTENACCADVNGLELDHYEILKNYGASLKGLIPFMGPKVLLGFFGGALYIVSSDAALSLKKEGQEQSNPSLEYFSRTVLAFSVLNNGLPSACILVVANVSYNFLVGKPLNSRFFFLRSKSYTKLGQIFSKVFNQISSNRFSDKISLVGEGLSFSIRAGLTVSLMANAFRTALTVYEKRSIDPIEKVFCLVVQRGIQYAVLKAWMVASSENAPESSSKDSPQ